MKIKILELEGKDITKEIEDSIDNGISLAGFDFKLNEELNVATNMYTSTTLEKLEQLSGCKNGHIQNMMKDKLLTAVKEIAIEISNIKSKAYVNSVKKMFDDEENKNEGI
ncbi:MAG: hypothetical protein RR585_04510 [Coprobacillus sp.]